MSNSVEDVVMLCNLRCEQMVNPIGIDEKAPRFGWELVSMRRGTSQTAYRLIVARTEEELTTESGLIWDTGKVLSNESIHCEYAGPLLQSRKRYFWKVRIWDERDIGSTWSDVAYWEMGLLENSEWIAKWIEPCQKPASLEKPVNFVEMFEGDGNDRQDTYAQLNRSPMIRKSFSTESVVKRARIYATAHGVYTLELNGKRVGNCEFAPEMTAYDKYLQYQTYDVTELIASGENVIGATLADGWYAGRVGLTGDSCQYGDMLALLLQLEIEYENGNELTVISDDSFRSSTGPLVYSDIFIGERYDSRLELNGWSTPGYDDSKWLPVNVADYNLTNLVAQYGEPVRALEEIQPLQILTTPKGETIIDLGQNIAGRIRMRVKGAAGIEITLEHSEVLDEHGNFLMNVMGRNKDQKDIYILKGDVVDEIYEPKFTFHGFRYIKVTGYPGVVAAENFTGIVLSSDLSPTGSFACSDSRINRLQANIVWSQKANMLSIPTDCPQRERTGWTGDIQVFTPTACFNMNVAAFLTRWLRNVALEQMGDGQVPIIVPYLKGIKDQVGMGIFNHSSAGWGDACIIVPWSLYNAYGDLRILKENYPVMHRWVKYIEKTASENIPEDINEEVTPERRDRQKYLWNTGFHFGDWLIPSLFLNNDQGPQTPMISAFATKELVSTCFYAYSAALFSKVSEILGRKNETDYYSSLNKKICEAFAAEYMNEDGSFKAHFQGIYILALQMNMTPVNMRNKVLNQLVHLIEQNGYRLDTGFVSVPFLLDVLCNNGRKDVAYKLLYQTQCPSWLYEVEKGATTIWESWNAILPDGRVTSASFNHYAFGCIGDWLYRHIAGLDKKQPGYKDILIKPDLVDGLTYAEASYKSIHGLVMSKWERLQDRLKIKLVIPANTRASVYLPNSRVDDVTEGGLCLKDNKDIIYFEQKDEKAYIQIGSGVYSFEYTLH